jgi:spore germination protein KA
MTRLLNSIKKLLLYKEPLDIEGFELLEDDSEQAVLHHRKDDEKQPNFKVKSSGKSFSEIKKKTIMRIEKVAPNLEKDKQKIKEEFNIPKNADVIIREFKIANKINAFIVYVDGMIDKKNVSNTVLRQLMKSDNLDEYFKNSTVSDLVDYICNSVLSTHETEKHTEYNNILQRVLSGYTALFIEKCSRCIVIDTIGYEKRAVEKPSVETVVNGPMEAFTETLRTNLTLVRKIIKNKDLMTEMIPLGKKSNTYCAVMYINGLVNPRLLKEVKRRIKAADIDIAFGNGMMAQIIEDRQFMILPQVLSTERPDRTASFLLEGHVGVFTDGTPFCNIVPVTFYHFMHTSEDSFINWQFATFLRLIRMLGLLFTVLLPGMYVALLGYHQEMIPTPLLASIASAREKVPFSTVIEVLFMEISFELIREGGIRIPGVIGQTLGIIGAVILGQAAVAANIVSPILIIVVALTGLGSFAIPNVSFGNASRLVRFIFIIFGSVAGFYGISAAFFIIGSLACNMKSFGVPYFAPIAPRTKRSGGLLYQQPISKRILRPDFMNVYNKRRSEVNPRRWKKK